MRIAAALFALLLSVSAARGEPADLPGWRGLRWDMTAAQIDAALDPPPSHLPAPWDFGSAYADRALFGQEVAGLGFNVFLQMNRKTDRLQQVLLERRQPTPRKAFRALIDRLEQDYGKATVNCQLRNSEGQPMLTELIWRFPTTTVHATMMDFRTSGIFTDDPNSDRDPLQPQYERDRNLTAFLPRRILIRFHASDRRDLMAQKGCVKR